MLYLVALLMPLVALADLKLDPYEDNPWFLGNDPVRYCVLQDEIAGVDVKGDIEKAIQNWVKTIVNITKVYESHNSHRKKLILPNGELGVISTIFREDCKNPELKFMINQEYDNGNISFSKRVSYNPDNGRSNGYIWLNANLPWRQGLVYAVVLHELGFVFGFSELDGEFMHPKTGKIVFNKVNEGEWSAEHLYREIDSNRFYKKIIRYSGKEICTDIRDARGIFPNSYLASRVCMKGGYQFTFLDSYRVLASGRLNFCKLEYSGIVYGNYNNNQKYTFFSLPNWDCNGWLESYDKSWKVDIRVNLKDIKLNKLNWGGANITFETAEGSLPLSLKSFSIIE